jgi:hypothetical protein
MDKTVANIILLTLTISPTSFAKPCNVPQQWHPLCSNIAERLNQSSKKMKLYPDEVKQLEQFLNSTPHDFIKIQSLQHSMPKTSLELLMSVRYRNVNSSDAEDMAAYLQHIVDSCNFKNLKSFDNNTSHIIGRDWDKIDYSGEGMTWQEQKNKYDLYGIHSFKTTENLKLFFPVESKLPYFIRIYQPAGTCHILREK